MLKFESNLVNSALSVKFIRVIKKAMFFNYNWRNSQQGLASVSRARYYRTSPRCDGERHALRPFKLVIPL